jgi:CBS domain-containing protein
MPTARDLMTSSPAALVETETLADAARLMAAESVGAIPVTSEDGAVVGMVTDRDIVVLGIAQDRDVTSTRLRDLLDANPTVVTVQADDDAEDVLETMSSNQIRRVPVLDGEALVGVISQADIARSLPDVEVADLLDAISQE